MRNFLSVQTRKKSRGVSAKIRINRLARVPKDIAASKSDLNDATPEGSAQNLMIVGEEGTPSKQRATVGALESLNKLNPSIRSLYTLNSDLPDNHVKYAPKSIYIQDMKS